MNLLALIELLCIKQYLPVQRTEQTGQFVNPNRKEQTEQVVRSVAGCWLFTVLILIIFKIIIISQAVKISFIQTTRWLRNLSIYVTSYSATYSSYSYSIMTAGVHSSIACKPCSCLKPSKANTKDD